MNLSQVCVLTHPRKYTAVCPLKANGCTIFMIKFQPIYFSILKSKIHKRSALMMNIVKYLEKEVLKLRRNFEIILYRTLFENGGYGG